MNSKEICEILKASKGTGIKEIKLKDVLLKFDNLTIEPKPNNNSTKIVPLNTERQTPIIDEIYDVSVIGEDKQTDEELKTIKDEFEMAHLMATDPEAFEKYQKGL